MQYLKGLKGVAAKIPKQRFSNNYQQSQSIAIVNYLLRILNETIVLQLHLTLYNRIAKLHIERINNDSISQRMLLSIEIA